VDEKTLLFVQTFQLRDTKNTTPHYPRNHFKTDQSDVSADQIRRIVNTFDTTIADSE
jgi:hypothetical protein